MDNVILCDISAWQYWRTPPVLRSIDIPLDLALAPAENDGLAMPKRTIMPRSNAREPERLILPRLLTDLKGLTFPVHVYAGSPTNRTASDLICVHRTPAWLPSSEVAPLGNGLSVVSPSFALCHSPIWRSKIEIARAMGEACGIFAIHHETKQTSCVLNQLLASNKLMPNKGSYQPSIPGFLDVNGNRLPLTSSNGSPLPWILSFDRNNRPTELWKRPPLTSTESLASLLSELGKQRGTLEARLALNLIQDGFASPLETQVFMLLCSSSQIGGLQLPKPYSNRMIKYDQKARSLSGSRHCFADFLWLNKQVVLEVNGMAFHADREGFILQSNRNAALKSMGFSVFDINFNQLKNLERFETVMEPLWKSLGLRRSFSEGAARSNRASFHQKVLTRSNFAS